MPSKNDLSQLKVRAKNTLQNIKNTEIPTAKGSAWRKPKHLAEKQSEMIGLRFTKQEHQLIKDKAGLVPIATYLKNALFTQTDIFK